MTSDTPTSAVEPDGIDNRRRRAVALAAAGDAESALAAWFGLLKLAPDDHAAHGAAGALLYELGRFAEAIPHLRRRAEGGASKSKHWRRLARACEQAGQRHDAVAAWRRVVEIDPDDAGARRRLPRLLLGLNDDPDAGLSPSEVQAKARAFDLLARGDPAAAEPIFRALAEARPEHPPAWMGLRGALHAQGRGDEADDVGRQWLAAAPAQATVVNSAMARRLSPRGLVFDPREPVPVQPVAAILTPVNEPAELRTVDNAIWTIDPGGQELTFSPVISLASDGSDLITARRRTTPSFMLALSNAAVAGPGAVITETGHILNELTKFKLDKLNARSENGAFQFDRAAFADGACGVKYFDTPALLMLGGNDRSFGDWIDDYPPKLALAEAAGLDCPILLRRDPLPQFVEMLEALGVERERMLVHDPAGVSVFPRLYVASWPVMHHDPMAGLFDIYRRVAVRTPARGRRRIYLSRAGIAQRPLVNEAEVRERFVRRGFEVVQPETLSFQATLELFSSPACLAGPFGSAFHNLVFCARKPVCLVLTPPFYEAWMEEIAFFFGLWGARFAYVAGAPSDGAAGTADDLMAPWCAPLDQIDEAIEKVLEAAAEEALDHGG